MTLTYLTAKLLKKLRFSAIKASRIHPTSRVESGGTVYGTTIAKHSFCGYDCSMLNVDIGAFCSIASKVTIGGVAHPMEYASTSPVFLSHKDSVKAKFARHDYLPEVRTSIGNDVWIGDGAYIKAGVHIGHGAVIGMGSVVTKDVFPYAIVAGNPAKLVRMRFDDNVVAALLAMAWWDFSDAELRRVARQFNDPAAMLAQEGYL